MMKKAKTAHYFVYPMNQQICEIDMYSKKILQTMPFNVTQGARCVTFSRQLIMFKPAEIGIQVEMHSFSQDEPRQLKPLRYRFTNFSIALQVE